MSVSQYSKDLIVSKLTLLKEEVDDLNAKIDETNSKIADLQARKTIMINKRDAVKVEIEAMKLDIA